MDKKNRPSALHILLAVVPALGLGFLQMVAPAGQAQKITIHEIEQGRDILRNVKSGIMKNYYDPTFRGMDIDKRFKLADEKMKSAKSNSQVFGIIAQVILDLNDSHTSFSPPLRTLRVEYGWQMKPLGGDCYVSAVKPGSDAQAEGLTVGDKVLSIDGRPMDRTKVWLAKYLYYVLRPQTAMVLIVQKFDGQQKQLVIQATTSDRNLELDSEEEDRLHRQRFYKPNDDVLIWKMPEFDLSEDEVDDKVGMFRNRKSLILDLRGNPGGYGVTLERLAGHFFTHDVKIADLKGRKEMKPMIARGHDQKAFKGKLIVLVDGESSSASEIFARVIQLEKRGTVIGDRTAGRVMQGEFYRLQVGTFKAIYFGINVTTANLIMTDGKSLEHVGVNPDELLLPTPEDLATNRDPVLAHAASLVGVKLDPEKAGALFPIEWRK